MYPVFQPGPYTKGDVVAHPEDGSLWIAQRDMANAKSLPAENAYWDSYTDPNYVPADPLKEIKDILTELSNRLTLVEQKLAGTPPPVEEPPIEEPPPPNEEEPPVEEPPVEEPPVVTNPPAIPPLNDLPVASVPFENETQYPLNLQLKQIEGILDIEPLGHIGAGQTTLYLDRIVDYPAGSQLLIPVGYEPGKGMRGTEGIDGQFPSYLYETLADMQADSGQAGGTYVGVKEDGGIYRRNGDTAQWQPYTQWGYYAKKIIPQGYKAKIVSSSVVDGKTVLEMDRAPKQTVTNAPVYWDGEPLLNQLFNLRDDFKLYPDTDKGFIFPKGKRIAIGKRIEVQKTFGMNTGKVVINGNGSELFSPPGFPSASFMVASEKTIVHDLFLTGNFKDNGFGFHSYPTVEYWNNPYENVPGFQFAGANCLGFNLVVKNCATYSLQLWNNGHIRDSKIILEEGIREYTGWQIHAIAVTTGGGFRNISFWSPYICNALEASRAANVLFENIDIVNGITAFNTAGGIVFRNSRIKMTERAKLQSFINSGHAYIDINRYMAEYDGAVDESVGGMTIENVEFIQEGFVDDGNLTLRAISGGTGLKNIKIKNCKYTRPAGSFACAVFLSDANNNVIDNFEVVGSVADHTPGKYYADISMVSDAGVLHTGGIVNNIKGARHVVVSKDVTVGIINPEAKVTVL